MQTKITAILLAVILGFSGMSGASEHVYEDMVISEGDDYDYLTIHDGENGATTVDMIGGYVYGLFVVDSARFTMTGGEITDLYAENSSTVTFSGGKLGDLMSYDTAEVNIEGGVIANGFQSEGNSVINVTGGDLSYCVCALASSTMNLRGGTFNDYLVALQESVVSVFGYDLEYDAASLYPNPWGEGYWGGGKITGKWADGSEFAINLVDNWGHGGDITFDHVVLHELPEPRVIYVDDDAAGANDGSSWENAFVALQEALGAAQRGDEILVAQGVYRPAGVDGDRNATFQLANEVIVKGGYAGLGEDEPDKCDVREYKTILSGDLKGDDGVGFVNMDENVYHVVTGVEMGMTASLEGFMITGGNADGEGPIDGRGGGVFNRYGSIRIVDCTLVGNMAGGGGGMYCYWESENTELTRCTFARNLADYGGGLSISRTSAVISNCVFANNEALGRGGAVGTEDNRPRFENCLFICNSSAGGGAISGFCSSFSIVNCTLAGNKASHYGGAVSATLECDTTIVNSILRGNDAPVGSQVYVSDPHGVSDLVISFSNIEDGQDGLYVDEGVRLVWGEGNISTDPCFVAPRYSGPVSYWKFDEGGGMTAYDSAGDNHGTVCGDADWTAGKIGGALSFDGWDDFVRVEHDDSLNITGDITISAWVYFARGGRYQAMVTKCRGSGRQNNPFDFRTSTSAEPDLAFVRADANGHERVYSTENMSLGEWHHVLVRVENNVPDFYVDGVITRKYADTVFTRTPTGNTEPLLIGCRSDGLDFKGLIDEVMIFDRALSAEEIGVLYEGGFSGIGDYHLSPDSPCIDVGDNSVVEPDSVDLAGDARILNGVVDMGAYEAPAPVEAQLRIMPSVINRGSNMRRIVAVMYLPEGVSASDVDEDTLLVLSPGEIEAILQRVSRGRNGMIYALFDKAELMDAVSRNGNIEISVKGMLKDGRRFVGTDSVRVMEKKGRSQRKPLSRRRR
jgi:hypothetical protein